MKTLDDLKEQLINDLEQDREEILNSPHSEDKLLGYVLNNLPIYNTDIVDVLRSHLCLGYNNNYEITNATTIFDWITWNIRDVLDETAHEWLVENK